MCEFDDRDAIDSVIRIAANRYREIETVLYDISRTRHELCRRIYEPLDALFKKELPLGYAMFTTAFLASRGNTFVEVDLRGPRRGIVNGDRLARDTIVIGLFETGLVFSQREGRTVGTFAAGSLHDPRTGSFDYNANRARKLPLWTGLHCANGFQRIILPFAGPMLRTHGNLQRLAQAAHGLTDSLRSLQSIDDEVERHLGHQATLLHTSRVAALRDLDLATFESDHAALIERLKSDDWYWDYADRPTDIARGRHEDLMIALKQLPYETIRGLWLNHVPDSMGIGSWRPGSWPKQHRLAA